MTLERRIERVRVRLQFARETNDVQRAWVLSRLLSRLQLMKEGKEEDPLLGKVWTLQLELDHIEETIRTDRAEGARLLGEWVADWQARGSLKLWATVPAERKTA